MKMKPAQRNAMKSIAVNAEREIRALEQSMAKHKPGTLPHKKLSSQLEDARESLRSAKSNLANTTQPNRTEKL